MTSAPLTAWSPPASGFDQLMTLWMLPFQLGLDLVQTSNALLLGALSRASVGVEKASDTMQNVARAAEEKIAEIDDTPGDTIPTPAALVA